MRLKGPQRYFLLFIVLIILQACSGGGSGSDSKDEPNPSAKRPTAIVTYDGTVIAGTLSHVSGSSSYSESGEKLSFAWEAIGKPETSHFDITGVADQAFWEFIPDAVGEYTFKLTVTGEQSGLSDSKTLSISSVNKSPVLENIGEYQPKINEPLSIPLSYSDPDGHSVTIHWELNTAPSGYTGIVKGESDGSTLDLELDAFGAYELEVYAYDGFERSDSQLLSLNVIKREYELYPLSFKPSQSIFLKIKNSLLLIDEKQPFLYIYDVQNHKLSKVDLPLYPLKMAVSQDQGTVAISTKSSLIQIDLSTLSVVSEVKTETYGGYPVFYNTNSVVMFPGRRNFNASLNLLRYIKDEALMPRLSQQYNNGEWGLSFNNTVRGGAVAKINPVTNDIYYTPTDVSATARPYTRLQITNDSVSDIFAPVITEDSVGLDFWFSSDGNLLTSGGILFEDFKRDPDAAVNEQTTILRRLPRDSLHDATYITSASIDVQSNQLLVTPSWSWREKSLNSVYSYTYDTFSPVSSFALPQVNDSGENYDLEALEVFHTNSGDSHLVIASYKTEPTSEYKTYFIASHLGGGYSEKPYSAQEIVSGNGDVLKTSEVINIEAKTISSYRTSDTDGQFLITDTPDGANVELQKSGPGAYSFKTDVQGYYSYKFIPNLQHMLPMYGRFLVNSSYNYEAVPLRNDIVDVSHQVNSENIYAISKSGLLTKINTRTLVEQSLDLEGRGFKVQLSPNNDLLIASLDNGLYTLDAQNLSVLYSRPTIYGARDITFRSNNEFFLSPDYDSDPTGIPNELLRFDTELNLTEGSTGIYSRVHCLYLSQSDDLFCIDFRMEAEENRLLDRYLSHYRDSHYINEYWLSHDESLMVKDKGAIQRFLPSPGTLNKQNKALIDDMTYQTVVGFNNETIADWAWGADDLFGYRVKGDFWSEPEYPNSSRIDVIDGEYFNVVDTIYFDSSLPIEGEDKLYVKFVMPTSKERVVNTVLCDESSLNCYFIKTTKLN